MSIRKLCLTVVLCIGMYTPMVHALADAATPQIVTARFRIFTDFSDEQALELAAHMARLHAFYSQFFDVDPRRKTQFNVRYFGTKNNFDEYLIAAIGRTYPHFIFLDYDNANENELLIYSQEEDFDNSLAYFAFVQFLENNILNAPLWIREGYGRYVENSSYDPVEDAITFRENDEWLIPLREIIIENELIDFEEFFRMDEEQALRNRRVFYPQAWGVVSFLVSYRDRGRDRLARDINGTLDRDASERENVAAALRILGAQFNLAVFESQFREFVLSKNSFEDVIVAAIAHYEARRLDEAEGAFNSAIALNNGNHVPYYYLGLISYDRREYELADYYYVQSLSRGADDATVYYALGLNALAADDRTRALLYFDQARSVDPTLFEEIRAILVETVN